MKRIITILPLVLLTACVNPDSLKVVDQSQSNKQFTPTIRQTASATSYQSNTSATAIASRQQRASVSHDNDTVTIGGGFVVGSGTGTIAAPVVGRRYQPATTLEQLESGDGFKPHSGGDDCRQRNEFVTVAEAMRLRALGAKCQAASRADDDKIFNVRR